MDNKKTADFVSDIWDKSIVPELCEYIKVPNKSPLFDPDWEQHGYMEQAVQMLEAWARQQPIAGMQIEVMRIEGRTPLLFIDIPGASDDVVLLYGHYDKQPEMIGWADDLGPWEPVIKDGKLYGRGGADDGYATFGSLTAIRALQEQGIPHAHCVVLIEGCEESGSFDLPYYIDLLGDRIGSPGLVVCLDAECGNYDQFWCTTSLRGNLTGTLRAEVLTEGVHSGDASGIVPSSFRVIRQLLSRVEDESSSTVIPRDFYVNIPRERVEQAHYAADILGSEVYAKFPFVHGAQPISSGTSELVLNRTWRPALAVTGAGGLPPLESAGNVLRPMTAVKLSLRLPPTCDADAATARLKGILERDSPYGVKVRFEPEQAATGWDAPAISPWLAKAIEKASRAYFGRPAVYMGEGGSIPFMAMLGERFPQAQFLVTGVLGPHSNAHGPNEFLHIPTGKTLTCCVAEVIADHYNSRQD